MSFEPNAIATNAAGAGQLQPTAHVPIAARRQRRGVRTHSSPELTRFINRFRENEQKRNVVREHFRANANTNPDTDLYRQIFLAMLNIRRNPQ